MRLLLDEQYSPEIAHQLQKADHDATAVKGDPGMEGMDDDPLLHAAVAGGRALLTNNVRDFAPLASQWAARGDDHFGLVFTSDESMPRSRGTIGLYVEKLDELLAQNPGDEALRNRIQWLS